MLIAPATAELLDGGMLIAYIAVALVGIWISVQNFRRADFDLRAWYLVLGAWGVMLVLKLGMEYVATHRAPLAQVTAPAQVTPPFEPAQCCTCAFVEQPGMTYDIAPRRERQ